MAVLVCPRCRRANPEYAVFCYFDGAELRPAFAPAAPAARPARSGPGQLPHDFVFPSGRRCGTFDELIQACQEERTQARALLRQDAFRQFLTSIGRMDLAQVARAARAQADPDAGLEAFLAGLPSARPRTPRLEVSPRRLALGTLRGGETRKVSLTVSNQGQGVLQGTLTVVDGKLDAFPWLRLADGGGNGRCAINTARAQDINLLVDTLGLPPAEAYAAKLEVVTNGGNADVPVQLEVAGQPFPLPPFQGAGTPRDLAERMRAHPRPAVALLENGAIARWFLTNGWAYPVEGVSARGVAAVQQFFEAMGLSRVPTVRVTEPEVHMAPLPPEVIRWELTLRTDAKKWVYAQVESNVPWLRILTPTVSGPRRAAVAFEVDSGLLESGRRYLGQVRITANAGQTMTVPVHVDVQGEDTPYTRRLFHPFLSSALAVIGGQLLFFGAAVGPVANSPALWGQVWNGRNGPPALREVVARMVVAANEFVKGGGLL
jgi:hypothetical protein